MGKRTTKKAAAKTSARKASPRKTTSKAAGQGKKATAKASPGSRTPAKKTPPRKPSGDTMSAKSKSKSAASKARPATKAAAAGKGAAKASAAKTPAKATVQPASAAATRVRPATRPSRVEARKASPRKVAGRDESRGGDAAAASKPAKRKKSPYGKKQLAPLEKLLHERRRRITGDLSLMGDEALRASDPDVDADNVADHGSDAYERNLTLGLMEHDSRTLQQIDLALAAMSEGVYGLCSDCDAAIPLARLEALPFATTCVPCQEKNEGLF